MLECVYVIWVGDNPDKGVVYKDIADYDRARERLNLAKVHYRCAVLPLLPVDLANDEVTRIINETITGKE